ncbi:DNA mismatch repair endonuclease MutL [Sulfobacillus harzensis]|uniref:DNA mismatch repair protein MutL n=1 Tax=Sulfobacillus harzensis TaxID=2729629 RepID=A0A7Y0L059_9FIRM|nr:DNA mismatch repair endonuclease MutL [Sulfobacillus harzensis]NMP20832.1 DNA mismatch repair endonuclease MutL [Sulfobacillus harzensis]
MSKIHLLDPIVANQIAAGEVVERPASVVKELVENSVDAGSARIHVEVESGIARVRVRDDGSGIEREDLPMALMRHTTSKIRRLEDLEAATTLGFRGEALAAISSVSELRLASRPSEAPVGHQIWVRYGDVAPVEPVAMGVGTEVEVSHIFAQHPARLKGLKTPAREFGVIQETVQQLALSQPEIQFHLIHDGRTVFQTAGRGHRPEAIMAVFGRDVASQLLPIDYETESGIRIEGFVAPAHIHRANRVGQGFYVNGRWVSHWGLRSVVEEAFRPNLPDRRYPYFWFWLTMPANELDPNAHPAKAEVRIYREQALKAVLFRLVRDALVKTSPSPRIEPNASSAEAVVGAPQSWAFDESLTGPSVLHSQYRQLVPLGQWQGKYILAQGAEGLCLIDQHAAHERIYFERFRRLGQEVRLAQPLLVPVAETLTGQEWGWFTTHEEEIRTWGFEVERLGGNTVAVRAVPTAFHDLASHQGLFRLVLELMGGSDMSLHPVSWAEEAHYAMAACKAAIKANRPLSYPEMVALLEDMARTEDPRGCPHGRPTMIVLTLEEVDRRFGRSG